MNVNWILASIDAALVGAMAVTWVLISAIRQDRGRLLSEAGELRRSVEALQSQIGELKAELESKAPPAPPKPFTPVAGLNADRRAEALELLRRGMDAGTVSATLRLSEAEANLLGKVQGLLTPAAARR